MTDRTALHRQIYCQAAKHIPEKGWGATVAVVLAHKGAAHQFGTGTLFRIGDDSFVVTASHVIKKANAHVRTLGITSSVNTIVAVPGTWICSSEGQYGNPDDPLAVTVYKLSKDAINKLGRKTYLTFDDIEFQSQSATDVYTLFGYSGFWADSTKTDTDRLQVKPLQSTTCAYNWDTGVIKDDQVRFHILLEAQLAHSIADDWSLAKLTDLKGNNAPFPGALGGISGCSVWRIGDLQVTIAKWPQDASRIVAVLPGGYDPKEAIIATKWVAVRTLIYGRVSGSPKNNATMADKVILTAGNLTMLFQLTEKTAPAEEFVMCH